MVPPASRLPVVMSAPCAPCESRYRFADRKNGFPFVDRTIGCPVCRSRSTILRINPRVNSKCLRSSSDRSARRFRTTVSRHGKHCPCRRPCGRHSSSPGIPHSESLNDSRVLKSRTLQAPTEEARADEPRSNGPVIVRNRLHLTMGTNSSSMTADERFDVRRHAFQGRTAPAAQRRSPRDLVTVHAVWSSKAVLIPADASGDRLRSCPACRPLVASE